MLNNLKQILIVIVKQIAIAFFFTSFVFFVSYLVFHKKLSTYMSLLANYTIVENEGSSEAIYDKT